MKQLQSLDQLFEELDIHQGKHISFHHHLRNGDLVINQVLAYYIKENVQDIHLFPSAIFPSYRTMTQLLERHQVNHITTNYISGDVAYFLSTKGQEHMLTMQTHGGRARSIIEGKSSIDIAFIAAPSVNFKGDAVGYMGQSRCGSLGYAVADSLHAKTVVLITDNLVDVEFNYREIDGDNVDYVVTVDSIGDPKGIVSGTTNVTSNPVGVKIAKQTATFLDTVGVIREGFSFQSGAGGISLKVTSELEDIMKRKQITASFFSGGITSFHVKLLEEGLVDKLYDVQCFDLEAIESIGKNKNHIPISASRYASPTDQNRVIKDLDIVILGATEIDLNFNVNVTTDSHGIIMGGSGGHSDTASEAKLSVIVSPLLKGRLSIIKKQVTTITTLGKHIDVLVTERGIAVNPLRTDLLEKLKGTNIDIKTIEELYEEAIHMTGIPKEIQRSDIEVGVIEDRTYDIVDVLYRK